MKILIVDDDDFSRALLTRQLLQLGYRDVIACERAANALTLLETGVETVDLILCDLQMPEMDGIEFVRQLVRLNFSGGLVLVSGEDERVLQTAEKLSRAHRLNVLGALHKPVSLDRLRRILDNHAAQPAKAPRANGKIYGPGELHQAIAGGELVNYYQPKVAIATGAVVGVETLVRWRHPQDGLVFPDQFIGAVEEHGLIDELTRTVLRGALRQARAWRDAGLHLHVAVNVSMDNLVSLSFPDLVVREADEAGVPLTGLVLEITESRLMKNPLVPLDILTRLRLKHISLSIDDFGTGHSSLAQLRDLPFDELKVDRGFVHGAARDSSLRAIVEANISLARQMNMRTVAEGVEDTEDWNLLRASGCDLAQGYLLSKPMSASDLPGWMAEWKIRQPRMVGAIV
jgi:EAL domain-containing protein (putative c-di-GMP-specific phosphodiesterase class I)/CheY-like chemotaxis protein